MDASGRWRPPKAASYLPLPGDTFAIFYLDPDNQAFPILLPKPA